ncbi:MAG: hypothetical protein AAF828_09890 [Bacteroidota bacterium]
MRTIILLSALALTVLSCETTPTVTETVSLTPAELNPPAEGFNATDSDVRAIEIADSVVWAHGGRVAYDNTRYFQWNFFGVRTLTWDKQEEKVRIDFPGKKATYLLDYTDMTGRVFIDSTELVAPDSITKYLKQAHSIWINDSYWLVHQFKLKDSGVTLKYVDKTPVDPQAARPSYIIDQTFAAVGDTPNNRYRLYIDQETFRINTWQFFRDAADEEVSMETPWQGYNAYNNGLQLSADRSGRFQLLDISTPEEMDKRVFLEM